MCSRYIAANPRRAASRARGVSASAATGAKPGARCDRGRSGTSRYDAVRSSTTLTSSRRRKTFREPQRRESYCGIRAWAIDNGYFDPQRDGALKNDCPSPAAWYQEEDPPPPPPAQP